MRPDRKKPERCLYEGNEEWLLIIVIGGKGDFPDEAQLQMGWPTYMKCFYFHGKIFFFFKYGVLFLGSQIQVITS